MHHLPRFFTHSKKQASMDSKNKRKPKLQRRNAAKHIEYDASSSGSSLDYSSSLSLHTRSLDLWDRTSFRIEGTDGEFDRVCRMLGLSGVEDFAIPPAAWEAMKMRSASDLLPRSRFTALDSPTTMEVKNQENQEHQEDVESELCARVLDSVRIVDAPELAGNESDESAYLNTYCTTACTATGGIKGVRPPVLKPPPAMRLPVIDNACSTWDLMKDFAGESDRGSLVVISSGLNSNEEKVRVQGVEVAVTKREEEDNLQRISEIAILSGSFCSFTTSNDDDSSSAATSNNVSPVGKFRRTWEYWEKGELLGSGSFGSVYEGISEDGFFFAVKEVSLLDQGSQGKQSIYQLEQEIALLSQFEHENIVQYYGTERDESKLYIFLELITKGSLLNLYQRYNLRDSQVSAYTRQILHGLKYLHERKVVHRDIKCANILVDANGSVKLADFGLAKATKLNDVRSCKGTAFWMAPEVVNMKNQGYGIPADIWSLGCTVLEMLTRQIPYSELECMQALYRIGKGVPPAVPESLSIEARDFILQCLQVIPYNRPTAEQLLDHPFVQRPLPTSSCPPSPYLGRRS